MTSILKGRQPQLKIICSIHHGYLKFLNRLYDITWFGAAYALYETGTAMNARESENYLPISRSSSASK
jgi:hypothetical protein